MSDGERLMKKRIEAMAWVVGAARRVVASEFCRTGAGDPMVGADEFGALARAVARFDEAVHAYDVEVGDVPPAPSGDAGGETKP